MVSTSILELAQALGGNQGEDEGLTITDDLVFLPVTEL